VNLRQAVHGGIQQMRARVSHAIPRFVLLAALERKSALTSITLSPRATSGSHASALALCGMAEKTKSTDPSNSGWMTRSDEER
jgi:hypothetical protein